MSDEVVIEITFLLKGHDITTRLARSAAVEYLLAEGWVAQVTEEDGRTTPIAELTDADLAKTVAVAALRSAIKADAGYLTIGEDEAAGSYVAVRARRVEGVRAILDFELDQGVLGRIFPEDPPDRVH